MRNKKKKKMYVPRLTEKITRTYVLKIQHFEY